MLTQEESPTQMFSIVLPQLQNSSFSEHPSVVEFISAVTKLSLITKLSLEDPCNSIYRNRNHSTYLLCAVISFSGFLYLSLIYSLLR